MGFWVFHHDRNHQETKLAVDLSLEHCTGLEASAVALIHDRGRSSRLEGT